MKFALICLFLLWYILLPRPHSNDFYVWLFVFKPFSWYSFFKNEFEQKTTYFLDDLDLWNENHENVEIKKLWGVTTWPTLPTLQAQASSSARHVLKKPLQLLSRLQSCLRLHEGCWSHWSAAPMPAWPADAGAWATGGATPPKKRSRLKRKRGGTGPSWRGRYSTVPGLFSPGFIFVHLY